MSILALILVGLGATAVIVGVSLWSVPAALIVLGLCLVGLGLLYDFDRRG